METHVKPQKKRNLTMLQVDGDLCFYSSGEVLKISDPDGAIRRLFQAMDGGHDIAQLHELLGAEFGLSLAELHQIIAQLDDARILENGAHTHHGLLDSYDLIRWDRNLNFLNTWASLTESKFQLQHRLKTARVALLGLGGLGSHILYDLAAVGIQNIHAVEFDRVEMSNLNRQILYNESDVGRHKSDVAFERIKAFCPRINAKIMRGFLSSVEDVSRIIDGCQYVICVADRPLASIMQWVNEACVRARLPLITGGLDSQRAVYYSVLPGQTGCIECWRTSVKEKDPESIRLQEAQQMVNDDGDNGTFVTLVSTLTGLMLSELVRLITGIAQPIATDKLLELHFSTMEPRISEQWSRHPTCPVCGSVTAGQH